MIMTRKRGSQIFLYTQMEKGEDVCKKNGRTAVWQVLYKSIMNADSPHFRKVMIYCEAVKCACNYCDMNTIKYCKFFETVEYLQSRTQMLPNIYYDKAYESI